MTKYDRYKLPDRLGLAGKNVPAAHNYQKKLNKLVEQGVLEVGGFSLINVAHDNWCDIYSGNLCNCNPTIQNRLTGKIYDV